MSSIDEGDDSKSLESQSLKVEEKKVVEDSSKKSENKCEDVDQVEENETSRKGSLEASASSWWSGWSLEKALGSVQSATNQAVLKAGQKSTEVYDFVRQDLGEVSSQTTQVLGSAASNIKKKLEDLDEKTDAMADEAVEKIKKSMTSLWKYAAGYDQLEDYSEPVAMTQDGKVIHLDRKHAQLYSIASDPNTFLVECDAEKSAEPINWEFDLDSHQAEISELIESNSTIVTNYMSLVPEKVSHKLFWLRYFYKVHLLELQEAKREALRKRVEEKRLDSDGDLNWDDIEEKDDKECSNNEQTEKKDVKNQKENPTQDSFDKTSSSDKDSPISDDWEKLSQNE